MRRATIPLFGLLVLSIPAVADAHWLHHQGWPAPLGRDHVHRLGKIGSVSDSGIGRMPLSEALKVLGLPFHS